MGDLPRWWTKEVWQRVGNVTRRHAFVLRKLKFLDLPNAEAWP